ncbi:hypothetical protein GMRT_12622 [Giardia muris]|uniref:Uncharacterized protein n=1 Tax=Giardia muris TaxID=5742 RepID=A0A4Z1SRW0_GIAMU|nr:hypothetical protein GMRT_12622 [Giardia muris]|eukprot:TNJ28490.1 hypothetical protein GMRT_12622 [Giardia muris]
MTSPRAPTCTCHCAQDSFLVWDIHYVVYMLVRNTLTHYRTKNALGPMAPRLRPNSRELRKIRRYFSRELPGLAQRWFASLTQTLSGQVIIERGPKLETAVAIDEAPIVLKLQDTLDEVIHERQAIGSEIRSLSEETEIRVGKLREENIDLRHQLRQVGLLPPE